MGISWDYTVRQAWMALWRNAGLHVGSVLAIAFSLLLVGLAGAAQANLQVVASNAASRSVITAYLQPHLTITGVRSAEARLSQTAGVETVQYVSQRQALAQMRLSLGAESTILKQLGSNPFSAYFAIRVAPARAAAVGRMAGLIPGVALVQNNQRILSRLAALVGAVRWIGTALWISAAVVALVVISHVIRLSLYARREEMQTLNLMGASAAFVAAPFIGEGLLVGGIGAVAAVALLAAALKLLGHGLHAVLGFVAWLPVPQLWVAAILPILGLGLACGGVGSAMAVIRGTR